MAEKDPKEPKQKKTRAGDKADKEEKAKRTIVRVKTPHAWNALIQEARENHWRRLEVTIQLREWLMAGKPASLDAAIAMLKARNLEDQIEAVREPIDAIAAGASDIEDPHLRAQAAERVAGDEGLCEFSRRPGFPGLWLPCNNIKAGFKENWSVLGLMNEVRGSRKAIAEGVFIFCKDSWDKPSAERDWIYLGSEDPAPQVHAAVSHSMSPKGPVSSIKRHEYVVRPEIIFDLYVAQYASVEDKLSDDDVAKALVHFCEHGLGACRSQGYGKFDLVQVRELEKTATTPASETVPAAPPAKAA